VSPVEFETILRRVVREEIERVLAGRQSTVVAPVESAAPVSLEGAQADSGSHPWDMTERDVRAIVRLRGMSEQEEKIFRMRWVAFSLQKKGYHAKASRMRSRADNLEKRLAA
jgi:hypothetical protein